MTVHSHERFSPKNAAPASQPSPKPRHPARRPPTVHTTANSGSNPSHTTPPRFHRGYASDNSTPAAAAAAHRPAITPIRMPRI